MKSIPQKLFRNPFFCFALGFFCLSFFLVSFVAVKSVSPDAIAVRIIPNPEHKSAMAWYRDQGFSGSPQAITIDGYSAVRDGRTVYVGAANINDDDDLFTNIYLLSFNQNAEKNTQDIFANILSHWKFNSNLVFNGSCQVETDRHCSVDDDCGEADFCASPKAQVVRDVKRLESLFEIKKSLKEYYEKQGNYPKVSAGSYLPNKTLSVWPSWQKVLSQDLGVNLPVDPMNRLGDCGGDNYNPLTCWDQTAKRFADSDPWNSTIDLPLGSSAFVYTTSEKGEGYDVCAMMESGYVQGVGSGACGGSSINLASSYDGNGQPVIIFANVEEGNFGYEYTGYFQVYDVDGDGITVSLDTSPSSWLGWSEAPKIIKLPSKNQYKLQADYAGPAGAYTFQVSLNDNRGEINSTNIYSYSIGIINTPPKFFVSNRFYSASSTQPVDFNLYVVEGESNYPVTYSFIGSNPEADISGLATSWDGNTGEYNLSGILSVSPDNIFNNQSGVTTFPYTFEATDNDGEISKTNFLIYIGNHAPNFILRGASETFNVVGFPIKPYRIHARDEEGNKLEFSSSVLPAGLSNVLIDSNTFEISGTPTGLHPKNKAYPVTVNVLDEYGFENNYKFVINVTNFSPVVSSFTCPQITRIGNSYSCDTIIASDPDGHEIVSYHIDYLPAGLTYDVSTGEISGTPTVAGRFNVLVTARDEYGAESLDMFFPITVNTYCGDDEKQAKNSEKRGGPVDDGVEQCDGIDGIAKSISESSVNKMYTCSSDCAEIGTCLGTCSFVTGNLGGYCGDNLTQSASIIFDGVGEDCDYATDINCCEDCRWTCDSSDYSLFDVKFTSGDSYVFSNGGTQNITLPSCRIHGQLSVDLTKKPNQERTAIVFVTDTSGSMGLTGIADVQLALNDSLDELATAASTGANIYVGLVNFGHYVQYYPSSSLYTLDSSMATLIKTNIISNYLPDGTTTNTASAVYRANLMLDSFNVGLGGRKIMVILSDGSPNPLPAQDPDPYSDWGKNRGFEYYTIAYTTNEGLQTTMCTWSNDRTSDGVLVYTCYTDHYSYTSVNAGVVFDAIINDILSKPGDAINVSVGGVNTPVTITGDSRSNVSLNVSLDCSEVAQNKTMEVSFTGSGSIEVSNMRFNYCQACILGTAYCGDDIQQYPNSGGLAEECDGVDLDGLNCVDRGFGGGTLSCYSGCTFNESGCCESIYGGWSEWGEWNECGGVCESETQTRTRACDNPAPACGNLDILGCSGSSTEIQICESDACGCTSETCDSLGYECSSIDDGCGITLDCGNCQDNASCDESLCLCDSGWVACDGDVNDEDGCEVNFDIDSDNCGACDVVCDSNSSCSFGACVCDTGWDDCDGNGACECDLESYVCESGSCI